MKKIEAIIRQEKVDDLKESIETNFIDFSLGMTLSQVLGFGHQKGVKDYVRGQEIISTFVPQVTVSFVIEDHFVEKVIEMIVKTCRTGEVGDGKIFVYPVEEAIRIRTGERGSAAL